MKLKISTNEYTIHATLLENQAPETIKILKEELPVKSLMRHSRICENEAMIPVPFHIDSKENPVYPSIGSIGFYNTRQVICIWYEEMIPLGPTNLFAQIDQEDLALCQKVLDELWNESGILVSLEIVEGDIK